MRTLSSANLPSASSSRVSPEIARLLGAATSFRLSKPTLTVLFSLLGPGLATSVGLSDPTSLTLPGQPSFAFAAQDALRESERSTTIEGPAAAIEDYLADLETFELPHELPSAAEVKDPIFALLIALVDEDLHGTLDQRRIQDELNRRHVKSKLPYQRVLDVTRLPVSSDRSVNEIHVRFDGPLKLPIPYSILGYNPGSLRATEECRFLEWKLGDIEIAYQKKEGDEYVDVPIPLQDVFLYGVIQGKLDLDIDGWVDRLMGGSLDDTGVVALMLCRYEGVWHGWAMGYNNDKKGRSGALDFREDAVVFPSPDGFKAVGRKMRARAEGLLQRAVLDMGAAQ